MTAAYICDAIRTPIGRYGGALAGVRADDLAAIPIKALVERNPSVDWSALDDVLYGCANQAGEDNRNVARMALLLAGLPKEVSGSTINRLCGSSMDAIAIASRAIKSGEVDLLVAGGVESMTRAPFVMGKADGGFSRSMKLEDTTMGWRFINPALKAKYGTDSMPETGETVAEEFHISRVDQDAFAFRSQQRAAAATKAGYFAEEIVPVSIPQKKGDPVIVTADEHPRPDTTMEGLAKLKGVVKPEGTVTAGNASGINDGACALADRFGRCRPPPRPYTESSHRFRRHRWCCASNYGHGSGSGHKKGTGKDKLEYFLDGRDRIERSFRFARVGGTPRTRRAG